MISKEVLSGGICVFQDDELYKFTSDAVLLSKFIKCKKNEVVADFCAGSGIVGLNFYALNKPFIKRLAFFEMQEPFCNLINKSIEYNGLTEISSVYNLKIQDIDASHNEKYSLITCNPPYFKPTETKTGENLSVKTAREELFLTLEELIVKVSKCLKFGGRFCMVHIIDRLADAICLMRKYNIEPKRLQFVSAKDKEPYLFIIEGAKGGKSGLKILKGAEN